VEKVKEAKSNIIHPEKPGAIGSRNSIHRDGRNEYQESSLLIDEEVDKILNHITTKLPPEVLNKLDVMGNVKDKIHNYYNQNLQNMQNRYLVTVEDELVKKYRDLVDKEEDKQLNKYTPRDVSEILKSIGKENRFNTLAIEKSIASVYEHLQGHLERGVQEFENNTNTLLRQKEDVGSFIRKENSYAIVKCSFKNNAEKSENVVDVKLAINILDSELITPIFHHQQPLQNLLKEIISNHIHDLINKSVKEININRVSTGQEELSSDESFVEKLQALENHLSFTDDAKDEESRQYDFIAKRFIDSLDTDNVEISDQEADIQNTIKAIVDRENIQNIGFNKVVNALTTILDDSKLGYQHIDNSKNARVCVIREYAITDQAELPDESFILRLQYLDQDQLVTLSKAYDIQFSELTNEIEKAGNVVERIYLEYRKENGLKSYQNISKEVLDQEESKPVKKWWKRGKSANVIDEEDDVLWNELAFMMASQDLNQSNTNTTNLAKSQMLKLRIKKMKEKILEVYGTQYPEDRIILEDRIKFLERKFQEFASRINPHHVQQGLILEVDITSVKRKRTTMTAMSNVLNEFLFKVSSGFSDEAEGSESMENFATDKKINQQFTSVLQNMEKSLEDVEA